MNIQDFEKLFKKVNRSLDRKIKELRQRTKELQSPSAKNAHLPR